MCSFKPFIYIAVFSATAFASSCGEKARPDPAFVIRVYSLSNGGFGYALYQGGRKIIDQPNIPAVQHLTPFRSREDAERTARLVSRKLESHQFPPAVTPGELDSLHIHY